MDKPTVIFEARLRNFIEDDLKHEHLKQCHEGLGKILQEPKIQDIFCTIDGDILPLLAGKFCSILQLSFVELFSYS